MIIGIVMLIISFAYMLLTAIIYFSKSRITNVENRIYTEMIITIFFGIFLETSSILTVPIRTEAPLINEIVNRGYLLYILVWAFLFTRYIIEISFGGNSNTEKKTKQIMDTLLVSSHIVFAVGLLVLPLQYHYDGTYVYSQGMATELLYIINFLDIGVWIYSIVISIKKVGYKKYVPLFAFIALAILNLIIRNINPGILLITVTQTFITIMMFYTIENPDMKMLEELYKNRKIIEKSNEDHSNFIFKMTQDVKSPIKKIIDITSDTNNETLKEINNLGKNLDYLVEDALDVSQMTTRKLKLYNTRYNPKNLLNEIKYRAESKLNDSTKLECNLSTNIPGYVYGDSIKIKQILSSFLDNSIKHTKKGYITLEVNTIIKYGICRFIIDVTDNGEGIPIDKVNEILSFKDTDETLNPDNEKLTLRESKLLTNKIGGSFMVKSSEESGTTVSITIDQKIVETKKTEISKKLELYEESLQTNKKIIVIDDDIKELTLITNYLEDNHMIVSGSLYARDAIEKIGNSHNFDLIILDDETSTYSAYETLKELKKNEKFNTPVVIMIDDSKEFIKLHYLKDGFADVIMKSKLKKELDRILKRF